MARLVERRNGELFERTYLVRVLSEQIARRRGHSAFQSERALRAALVDLLDELDRQGIAAGTKVRRFLRSLLAVVR